MLLRLSQRLVLWYSMGSIVEGVPCVPEKNVFCGCWVECCAEGCYWSLCSAGLFRSPVPQFGQCSLSVLRCSDAGCAYTCNHCVIPGNCPLCHCAVSAFVSSDTRLQSCSLLAPSWQPWYSPGMSPDSCICRSAEAEQHAGLVLNHNISFLTDF